MPYEYLTFDETKLETEITSGSYFDQNLQELYEQTYVNQEQYFGLSEQDVVELSIYDSNQEFVRFDRIEPVYKFVVTQGTFVDLNGNIQQYNSVSPSTNYLKYNNSVLLNIKNHLSSSNIGPGLYYTSYNFVRNIAGNTTNKLVIKEISPSRTEVKFSIAFDRNKNEQTLLDYNRIQTFAQKKFLFIQTSNLLFKQIDSNELEKNYKDISENDKLYVASKLGLKNTSELIEFIRKSYNGFSKILKYYSSDETGSVIEETKKFDGVSENLKNFIRQYNQTPFSLEEILLSFETITKQICQNRILQKTTLTTDVLDKCVELFVNTIFNLNFGLRNKIINTLDAYSNRFYGLFKNAINFDNGELIKIIDHTSYTNPTDNLVNIHVKLENPLPNQYSTRTTCWISNVSIAPFYFKTNYRSQATLQKIFLNGVNFDVNVNTSYPSTEKFDVETEKTLENSILNLNKKYNELYTDYTKFEEFVLYSSAELRTKIAKNKILEYQTLDSKKSAVKQRANESITSISSSLSTDYSNFEKKQIQLLDSFDEYESYLYFNSSSIDDKIFEGIDYDKQNLDSLNNQLPEYLQSDEQSSEYLIFTSMVGHFFDNILNYIKKFPKTYGLSNDENKFYPKNYIDELLNSFNWETIGFKLENSNISKYLSTSTTNSVSYFEYTKSIFNRFANNLPIIYKTKGTKNSFDLINNIFGIPTGLIKLKEYGTADYIVNQTQHYEYDSVVYLTKFDSNQYINFEFTGSEFSFEKLNEFTSSIDGGINKVTSSYLEKNTGINSLEFSFKWSDTQNVPNYNSKTTLLKKIRNENIDWQISLLKNSHKPNGKVVFEIHPPESGISNQIVSDEFPLFNGNIYTVALSKELLSGYAFDELTPTSGSFTVGSSEVLAFTSSTEEKYLPNKYTLYVAQNDGSYNNFYGSNSKVILYDQNKYFSSGSYYFGNYNASSNFKGNIDKLKVYKPSLSEEEFIAHSYNINSISKENKETLYSDLIYLWSFDTPIDLWSNTSSVETKVIKNQNEYYSDLTFSAVGFTGKSVVLPYPDCTPAIVSNFPYQFDRLEIKQSLISVTNFGPNYKNSPKITKINETAQASLVPYDYSTGTLDIIGSDSNLIGYYISPYTYLETKIEEFLGKDGVSKIIGDPSNLDKQEYVGLKELQSQFAQINKKYIYPQEYYSTFKFYVDFSIFDYVQKLIPNRASLKKGLLLEPSVFERKKINLKSLNILNDQNYNFTMSFDNSAKFETQLNSTFDLDKNANISAITYTSSIDYPLNYSSTLVYDSIDEKDFIYSKYGKYINITENGYTEKEIYNINNIEYRKIKNNDGSLITFFDDYSKIEYIGSGSITGSAKFKSVYDIYSGSMGSGYSDRHLSKFLLPCSKRSYKAISQASAELFGVEILVVNEKWSTYQNNEDGIILIRPIFGTGRNVTIYNETRDDTYLGIDRSEFITISNLSGSATIQSAIDNGLVQSFTVEDSGVIGSTEAPKFKFDVIVGYTYASLTPLSGPNVYTSGNLYLYPTGSAVRVYDAQTGVAGDWIEVPNQVANTEEFDAAGATRLLYSGIDRNESECFIVDGKFNEVIYGNRDAYLKNKVKYYDHVKSECNRYNSVDRNGNYKGSPPIITINGFLSLRNDTDQLSLPGQITQSADNSGFEYIPGSLTASLELSSSLETYIYNL